MASYVLRDVDNDLWKRVKVKAAQDGKPIKAVILELLTNYTKGVVSVVLLGLLLSACGSSSPSSPSPVPTPTPTPPAPTTVTITGHVTAVNGGQPLSGVQAALGTTTITTDGSGSFSTSMPPQASISLALTGASIVPRTIRIAATNTRDVTADAILMGGGFDLNFYRQLVRNATEGGNLPLRRWTKAPSVYLRTVNDAGTAIDTRTLDMTERTIRDSVPLWTAGAYSPTIERGTDMRAGQSGWVTVLWSADPAAPRCGSADVAVEGGTVNFYPGRRTCACGGYVIAPAAVRHEFGHAMGFWHTDATSDIMTPSGYQCDQQPSARELYHARIAYARPVGNVDPDQDPSSVVTLAPLRAIE